MADGTAAEAAAVTAFWRGLGLPGLVDVHTHFMPDNVLVKVWDFFDSRRAAVGQPWPTVYRRPEQERLGPDWLRAVCHGNATRLLGL